MFHFHIIPLQIALNLIFEIEISTFLLYYILIIFIVYCLAYCIKYLQENGVTLGQVVYFSFICTVHVSV